MEVISIMPRSFASNCYLICDSGHAIVVDPSVSEENIIKALAERDLTLDAIMLTHGHFDHILSLDSLRAKTGAPTYIHKDDAEMLSDGDKNAFKTFFGKDRAFGNAERTFEDGDVIPLGSGEVKIISTPGHTRGSSCFLCGDSLISGDTLFADSYGRCDLYGGDIRALRASLKMLRTLDGGLTVYSGHGRAEKLSRALDNVIYF